AMICICRMESSPSVVILNWIPLGAVNDFSKDTLAEPSCSVAGCAFSLPGTVSSSKLSMDCDRSLFWPGWQAVSKASDKIAGVKNLFIFKIRLELSNPEHPAGTLTRYRVNKGNFFIFVIPYPSIQVVFLAIGFRFASRGGSLWKPM